MIKLNVGYCDSCFIQLSKFIAIDITRIPWIFQNWRQDFMQYIFHEKIILKVKIMWDYLDKNLHVHVSSILINSDDVCMYYILNIPHNLNMIESWFRNVIISRTQVDITLIQKSNDWVRFIFPYLIFSQYIFSCNI